MLGAWVSICIIRTATAVLHSVRTVEGWPGSFGQLLIVTQLHAATRHAHTVCARRLLGGAATCPLVVFLFLLVMAASAVDHTYGAYCSLIHQPHPTNSTLHTHACVGLTMATQGPDNTCCSCVNYYVLLRFVLCPAVAAQQ